MLADRGAGRAAEGRRVPWADLCARGGHVAQVPLALPRADRALTQGSSALHLLALTLRRAAVRYDALT